MRQRLHLFEFEDQSWLPQIFRQGITEFLATVTRMTQLWKPTVPVIQNLIESSSEKRIVVLGAGSGGGILDVLPFLSQDTSVVLTDLFPNTEFTHLDSRLTYWQEPVNATSVPDSLHGVRVMYAAFHHLTPEQAKDVLKDAMKSRQPLAIFEGTERSVKGLIAILLTPVMVLLLTPFVRPWRWSRLVFTYILPVFPILIFWDGLVSALRTYSLEEMMALTSSLSEEEVFGPDFFWQIEVLKGPRGENIPSLTGRPKKA